MRIFLKLISPKNCTNNARYQTRTSHKNSDDAGRWVSRYSIGQSDGVARLFPREPHTGRALEADVAADRFAVRVPLFYDVGTHLQPGNLL